MIIVRMRHVRAAHGCSPGLRRFFRRHNLDLREFCRSGLPIDVVEATGDAMAMRVCDEARRDERK
jgi:hypothetical protein